MRKFIHFFFFICVSLLIVIISDQVSAEQLPVKIQTNNKTVTVDIKTAGDYYKVFKDDKLIYKGSSNKFKDKLTDDLQKYKIGVFEKKKIKKVLKINVDNPQKEQSQSNGYYTKSLQAKAMEKAVNNSIIENITSDKSVILNWRNLPDKDGIYEVYKNDKKIGETTNLTFTDNEVTPGKEYKYTIKAQIKMPQMDSQQITREIIKNKIKLTEKEKNEIYSINGDVSTFIKIPKNTETELNKSEQIINTEDQPKTNSLPKDNVYSFVYRTFIPYKSVKDLNPFGKGYLKGDNRSFATDSDKFRTESDVNAQFSGPTGTTLWKEVGRSHRCKDEGCKKIIESGRASSSGIQKSTGTVTSSRIEWSVRHSVGVPFNAAYPNIDYQYYADLKKYTVFLSGTHDGAPNHEFYLFSMGGSNRFIHSHAVKSKGEFWKLLGLGMGNFWRVTI